jgi:hypothetical protein
LLDDAKEDVTGVIKRGQFVFQNRSGRTALIQPASWTGIFFLLLVTSTRAEQNVIL